MNSITFLKDNNNLSVNTTIVAKSLQVDEINVSNDIYVNNSIYTPVGSIITYAGVNAPNGWLLCNGSEVSKTLYSRLFSVIGNLYGDASTSDKFVLPNLVDRVPVGKTNSGQLGNVGGNNSITLSVSQLPSHTHTGTTSNNGSHTHGVTDPGHNHSYVDAYFAEADGNAVQNNVFGTSASADNDNEYRYRPDAITSNASTNISIQNSGDHNHTFTTQSTGNGTEIDIRNKFILLNYIIRY